MIARDPLLLFNIEAELRSRLAWEVPVVKGKC